ncbi:hypothetical protein [uncultured Dietzia sp.]|uniref:hypothetical protein n=1 Tax=uncultured Dietzia sp. TaxID=395519 RepID=UPI0025E5F3E8|nr:hypothetical protein [uncultured Dietzia sp.]
MTVTEELSDTGLRPRWAAESFPEPEADVTQSIARVESDPFLLHATTVRSSTTSPAANCARSPD